MLTLLFHHLSLYWMRDAWVSHDISARRAAYQELIRQTKENIQNV